MPAPPRIRLCCLLLVAVGTTWIGTGSLRAGQDNAQAGDNGPEALARGPVHEAFAQPVVFDPQPGITAPRKPPETIEELPPEQKPEGSHVVWISGYWQWDDQRQDFIWVSGLWRAIPPDRVWVSGYWTNVENGYQWVSGFWSSTESEEVVYLPKPPATLEEGPNSDAPSANHIWAPGCWVWSDTRYAWRPGYWITGEQDWVWTPAYYSWTPGGYIYVAGHWDYLLDNRGLMYAPVVLNTRLVRADFVYTPTVVIDTRVLTSYLFVRPRTHHYVFGDYYDVSYLQAGVYPWFAFHSSRYGYDPIYADHNWRHGREDRWAVNLRENYWRLRENREARPPQTFAAWQNFGRDRRGRADDQRLTLMHTVQEVTRQRNVLNVRLETVETQRRRDFATSARDQRNIVKERAKWESRQVSQSAKVNEEGSREEKPGQGEHVTRWRMPRSTTVIAPGKLAGKGPPPAPQASRQSVSNQGQQPDQGQTRDPRDGQGRVGGEGQPGRVQRRPLPGPEELLRPPQGGDPTRDRTGPGRNVQPTGRDRDGRDRDDRPRPPMPPAGRDRDDSGRSDRSGVPPTGREDQDHKGDLPPGRNQGTRPPLQPTQRDRDDRDRTRPPVTPTSRDREDPNRSRPPILPTNRERDTGRDRPPVPPPGRDRDSDRSSTPPGQRDRGGDRPPTPPPGRDREANRPKPTSTDRDRTPLPPSRDRDRDKDKDKDR